MPRGGRHRARARAAAAAARGRPIERRRRPRACPAARGVPRRLARGVTLKRRKRTRADARRRSRRRNFRAPSRGRRRRHASASACRGKTRGRVKRSKRRSTMSVSTDEICSFQTYETTTRSLPNESVKPPTPRRAPPFYLFSPLSRHLHCNPSTTSRVLQSGSRKNIAGRPLLDAVYGTPSRSSVSISGARCLRVVRYKANVAGWSSKASGGVQRHRGRGLKARGDGRRDTPGKVLKDRRSPRQRGRMGTSV